MISIDIVLLLLAPMAIWAAFSCGTYRTNMGASYDLTELVRSATDTPYIVEDGDIPCTKTIEKNYTYYFNICGIVSSGVPKKCRDIGGIGSAAALQVNEQGTATENDDWCYVVGKYDESTTQIGLIEADDPTEGIRVTYLGDICKSTSKPRQFHLDLICDDRLNPSPTHAYEQPTCEYTVTIPSVYGCPVECPVANRKLCGGNGHCAYDEDASASKCFCNHGYTGSDCNSVESTSSTINYSPALLGLIITLFIIVAILVASLALLVRQMAAYKEDVSNYQALKGGDDVATV